jgi:TonB family protein
MSGTGASRPGRHGAAAYLPSFLLSLGVHGAFLLAVGVLLTVTGGPRHTASVEMDVVRPSRSAPPPPPPPPTTTSAPTAPVRSRRSARPSGDPPPTTPTPVVDTGPAAPNASENAMPASPAAPASGGSPEGVLGGSNDAHAQGPGGSGTSPAPAPPERRVYDMADLDAPPALVGNCSAEVPAFARQTNQSGWVMLQFTLDPEGHVQSPRVRAGSPPGVFDAAALDAIRRCRYTAPRVGGRTVSVTFRQRLRFEP